MNVNEAKAKLDRVIQLSRVEMYKPIQVAEILKELKDNQLIKPLNLETYRNLSKELRDNITSQLFGKVSTSSMRYQDDLWNDSAIPPTALSILAEVNKHKSMVEEYIYQHVYAKNKNVIELRRILNKIQNVEDVLRIFESFDIPSLRSSADRLYEVFTISVLQTDLENSDFKITLHGNIESLKGTSASKLISATENKINELQLSKMGHTNAADAGLDIWTNFGVVINVKNYELSLDLFKNILGDTPVGHLVIVCEKVSSNLIENYKETSKGRTVTFITREELIKDVQRILNDKNKSKEFINRFVNFFDGEFPLSRTLEDFMKMRNYQISIPSDLPW